MKKKTNEELQAEVLDAIRWEPLLHSATISVIAKDGVVSLTGAVDSHAKKMEAAVTAKKVIGVNALVDDIEVVFSPGSWSKTDAEVTKEVLAVLRSSYPVPNDKVIVNVKDGWVTLGGELAWNYQKEAAKNALNYLTSIKGITDNIVITPDRHVLPRQIDIEEAISRSWSINGSDVNIRVSGTTVTLTGTVKSWHQKEEAGRLAWNTPGIQQLENELMVDYYYSLMD